jgi:hypothetical protein
LKDLVGCESDFSVSCVLDAVINLLKKEIDGLCGVHRFIHAAFAFLNVGWRYFAISVE